MGCSWKVKQVPLKHSTRFRLPPPPPARIVQWEDTALSMPERRFDPACERQRHVTFCDLIRGTKSTGCSLAAKAPDLGSGNRGFDYRHPDQPSAMDRASRSYRQESRFESG